VQKGITSLTIVALHQLDVISLQSLNIASCTAYLNTISGFSALLESLIDCCIAPIFSDFLFFITACIFAITHISPLLKIQPF